MADQTINQNGLSQMASFDLPPDTTISIMNQSDYYFKNTNNPNNIPSANYEDTAPENGINNETQEHKQFTQSQTYEQWYDANGSAILAVNDGQVGNEDVAQTLDYTNYDAYFNAPNIKKQS